MKNQPNLHLTQTPLERRLQWAAFLLVAANFLLAAVYYPSLPEQIPVHFSGSGNIDRMAGKLAIFELPAIGLLLCALLTVAARFPHKFNYLNTITPENAATEYRQARRMLGIVNVLDGVLFLLLSMSTIWAAHSGSFTSAIWLVVAMLVVTPWFLLGKTSRKTPVSS